MRRDAIEGLRTDALVFSVLGATVALLSVAVGPNGVPPWTRPAARLGDALAYGGASGAGAVVGRRLVAWWYRPWRTDGP